MKKTLIALAAAGMLASTAAMASQPHHRDDPRAMSQNEQRWDDALASIDEARFRGSTRVSSAASTTAKSEMHEARRLLKRELRDIEAKEARLQEDGRLSRRVTDTLTRSHGSPADQCALQIRRLRDGPRSKSLQYKS
jgi:Skp family chaperone for outer membrane proteins